MKDDELREHLKRWGLLAVFCIAFLGMIAYSLEVAHASGENVYLYDNATYTNANPTNSYDYVLMNSVVFTGEPENLNFWVELLGMWPGYPSGVAVWVNARIYQNGAWRSDLGTFTNQIYGWTTWTFDSHIGGETGFHAGDNLAVYTYILNYGDTDYYIESRNLIINYLTANVPPNQPTNLLVEDLPSTAIIHTTTPHFSFTYTDNDSDPMTQLEIQVGSDPTIMEDTINDMWDAVVIESVDNGGTATITYGNNQGGYNIGYGPYSLTENTVYYWRVRADDGSGDWGQWSSYLTVYMHPDTLLETDNFEIVPVTPENNDVWRIPVPWGENKSFWELTFGVYTDLIGPLFWCILVGLISGLVWIKTQHTGPALAIMLLMSAVLAVVLEGTGSLVMGLFAVLALVGIVYKALVH